MSFISVDIGATKIRVAIGDETGIQKKLTRITDTKKDPLAVSNQIIRLVNKLRFDNILSIGVGSIGPIDIKKGKIINTPNFPQKEILIKKPLSEYYNIPVMIVNDCAAAVHGEYVFGDGQGLENIVYITISTGLGGGAIVDGHLLQGKDGNAPEPGHFTISSSSKMVCNCGCIGHWEAYSGGKNIPKFAKIFLNNINWRKSLLWNLCDGNPDVLTSKNIFDAAKRKDPISIGFVNELGKINAIGIANIINGYDPELITIGGSVALNNSDLILEPIISNIDKHIINRKPDIQITRLGEDIVLLGALSLAIKLVS
jgi:glucokinase